MPPKRYSRTPNKANKAGRGVEVAAAAAEEVGQRESRGGRDEERQGDEHFAPLDQRYQVTEKLRKRFAGQPAIGSGRLHEWKRNHGHEDGCGEDQAAASGER